MKKLAFFIFVLCIGGCWNHTDAIENDFSTYLSRLANVQDVDSLPLPKTRYSRLPDIRDLKQNLEPITLGLLDSYQLRHCQLFQLIAEKNSILGKVQDAFHDYDYQRQLLISIGRCLDDAQIREPLKSQLSEIQTLKHSQFPIRLSNLLFTSQAMRQQLETHSWLTQADFMNASQVIQALMILVKSDVTHLSIAELSQLDPTIHIVPTQNILENQPIIGKLNYSLANATAWLNVVNRQLEKYNTVIKCGENRDMTKLNHLTNVFHQFYVVKLQPYLARLNRLYFQFQPFITFLNTHPSYQYPLERHYQQFHQQTQRHVKYWQQLSKRCHINLVEPLNLHVGE